MDYDADLHGPLESVVADICDPADEALQGQLWVDPPLTASAPNYSHPYSESFATGSSLIEEAWVSDHGERTCDHYLEHRLMAQEYEGLRMGRELHDSTAQLLLSLRLSVAHLKSAYELGKSEEILEEISETVRQIDQEIRAFSYLHYPAELGEGGLVAALNTLARGFADRTGLKIVFKALGRRTIANGAASIALLRVAQEALMNVHRHAQAGLVRMSLVERGDAVELSIQDDGQGMPPPTSESVSKGLGLQGMRHRVERLGGQFSIRRLKRGTKLVARLAIGCDVSAALKQPDRRNPGYPYHAQ